MNRILIADDEPVERLVLEKRIRKNFGEAVTIFQAENGREALELQRREHCQVLVLDISMPELTGLEAAEELRKTDSDAVIIFLTAFDDFAYTRKAIRVKALDYLLKPCEESELISVLEEALYQAGQQDRATRKGDPAAADSIVSDPAGSVGGQRMQQIARLIREFVEAHFSEEISMQDAAREFGYSEAYFCKLFKQCFDQNFTLYLAGIRVREAKILLENPLVNVRDVSRRVGYFDSNYFAKVFKRMTGMNPSEYRDRQSAQK